MKKITAFVLVLMIMISVCGCSAKHVETTQPDETESTVGTSAPMETEPPVSETVVPETTVSAPPSGYLRLDDAIAGTEIVCTVDGKQITLSEDGLTIQFGGNTKLVYRDDYVIAVMPYRVKYREDGIFIHEKFFKTFFRNDDSETVSLFHGTFFFPEEVLELLDTPDGSVFQQKLAAEVLLPTSMGIESPHVDMNRIFQYRLLSEYPTVLSQELERYGYKNAQDYTYTEYVILSGAQTLDRAGIRGDITGKIPYDPQMTVWEYNKLTSENSMKEYMSMLSEEQKAFATEKKLETSDMWHLQRVFDQVNWGDFMKETDETLRATLEEYYETDIIFLRDWVREASE